MTKAKFYALLVAAGAAGFGSATALKFSTTGGAHATVIHALRIQASTLPDAGLGPDRITAWRSNVALTSDGGLEVTDIGPANCTGDSKALRKLTSLSAPIIEVRAGQGEAAQVEVYERTKRIDLRLPSRAVLHPFVDKLNCVDEKVTRNVVNQL